MRFDPQSNIIVSQESATVATTVTSSRGGRWAGIMTVALLIAAGGGVMWLWGGFGPQSASAAAPSMPEPVTTFAEIRTADLADPGATMSPAMEAETLERLDGVRRATSHLVLMREAERLMGGGRYAEAIPLLEEVVTLRPHQDEARYKLGLAYARMGNHDGVRVQQVALSELDPNLSNLLGNLVR